MNKKIFVTQSALPPIEEYIEEISSLWETHRLTNMGNKHKELQEELKKYLGVKEIDLFTNGHMALELVLQALDLKGEVITTPFTFASTTHAIVRNGLTPVFCDIDADSYCIDTNKIEELITEKTSAIVPVHVYGNVCNVEIIDEIAKKNDLKVIYDAAHAFGVKYKGMGIGNYGDASVFSFHATKVFNTIEGGATSFRDDELKNKLYGLKNFGIRDEIIVDLIGANAKMNEFEAAMGLCNLRHISSEIAKRELIVEYYNDLLREVEGIRLNQYQSEVESNFAYYPIIVDEKKYGMNRDCLAEILKSENIYVRKYFYPITCDFECYKYLHTTNNVSVARYISERVLTLPLYSTLEMETVEKICKIIKKNKKISNIN